MTQCADPAGEGAGSGRDETWNEIRRLLDEASSLARRKENEARLALLLRRAIRKAARLRGPSRRALNAADLRRLGWNFADIATRLGTTPEDARRLVTELTLRAHVRAMATSRAAPVRRWPLDRVALPEQIIVALRAHSVVTVGHLVRLDREALRGMEGIDGRAIQMIFKIIREVLEGE